MTSPNSIGSAWGTAQRPFREVLGSCARFAGDELLLDSAVRPVDATYAAASSAWIVLGRADVASIAAFNHRGRQFSSDGRTLCGAFGARIRAVDGGGAIGGGSADQLEAALALLEADPNTRRAAMLIGRPSDLLDPARDFPCATSAHLLVRGGRVHLSVHMRSQSLLGVFPYDLVNFAQLRNYAAWRLGRPSGEVVFTFASLHLYEDEVDTASRVLTDPDTVFTTMPSLDWSNLSAQFDAWVDEALRSDR